MMSKYQRAGAKPEDLCGPRKQSFRSGFTFVEMLAIVLTLSLLVSVSVPAFVRARQNSLQDVCRANLNQIGLALQLYADANQDRLPGPVFALAQPAYCLESKHELVWFLAGKLNLPEPGTNTAKADVFICPASMDCSEAGAALRPRRSYALNEAIALSDGGCVTPFGRAIPPVATPVKVSTLATRVAVATAWALADADKGNVNPTLQGWNELSYRPVHGEVRNQLYFDWHVGLKRW